MARLDDGDHTMREIIETAGARIALTEEGGGEPAFVFLHYWGGSGRTWRHVAAELPGFRRLLPDLRGWGASVATDGQYGLEQMADDVVALIKARELRRFVLVGHSMGGKIAQMLAIRRVPGLAGLVLVAPAPPSAMPVPSEARAGMLASYGSTEGVIQALGVLSGRPLSESDRTMVFEDTLRGAEGAKRAWTDAGMIQELGPGLEQYTGPAAILVGSADRVENADRLRALYAKALPGAVFHRLEGIGHLSPLEAPGEIARACREVAAQVNSAA